MKKGGRVIALASGGPDSAALLLHLSRRFTRVFPLYIRAGLSWEKPELAAMHRFLRSARIPGVAGPRVMALPSTDIYRGHWSVTHKNVPGARSASRSVYLPGRNLLLISKAAVLAPLLKAGSIAIGTLKGNPFNDATRCFRYAMSKAVSLAMGTPIRVIAPFTRLHKEDLIKMSARLPLHLTFSCINPVRGRHCGKCNKCAERMGAFRKAGITDRTGYFYRPAR
jgi:7-cyano-7-deazaguanine synthase